MLEVIVIFTHLRTYHEVACTFVYHCHIVTHEDRDMMRPFCVLNEDGSTPPSCIIQDTPYECKKVSEGLKGTKKGKHGKATKDKHFTLPACPKKSDCKMKNGKKLGGKMKTGKQAKNKKGN